MLLQVDCDVSVRAAIPPETVIELYALPTYAKGNKAEHDAEEYQIVFKPVHVS